MPISEVKPKGQIKPSNIVCFPGKFTEFLSRDIDMIYNNVFIWCGLKPHFFRVYW